MYERVRAYVKKYHMLQEKDHVIAGVSGGADSVCLLFMLVKLQKEMRFGLTVVHIHHGLRGESADADENYVRALCEKLDVELLAFHEDVGRYAKEQKLTLEEAGRNVRRHIFEEVCHRKNGTRIALAHHQNDNAETLLWNLSRGCGLKGIGGISPVDGKYIRPLLGVRRQEIEEYLKENNIDYCTDETNLEDHYTRNRLRNHVIPYLEREINPRAVSHMADTMEQMRTVWAFMEEEVEKCRKYCVKPKQDKADGVVILEEGFRSVNETVRTFLIHELLCETAGRKKDIEQIHVKLVEELMEHQTGRKIMLPYEMTGERCYEGIWLHKVKDKEKSGENSKPPVQMRILERTPQTSVFPKKTYTKWFDYDIIKSTVKIRHKQPGDYITIDKNGSTQSLKKYFVNVKVPREDREKIWLAADGSHILWIIGYRQNQAYQITDKTRRILEIEFNGGEEDGRERVKVLVPEEDVAKRIKELGEQISKDYAGKQVHLICVLKGGVFFMCELAKRITVPVSMDFMSVSSYGDGTKSSGVVKIAKDLDETLEGKNVLIVEDIIDSGRTLYYLMDILSKRNPKSMKLCTLLDKPERRVKDVKVDYVGFNIPDEFVVGYGLDYAQRYRNLPFIGVVEGVK